MEFLYLRFVFHADFVTVVGVVSQPKYDLVCAWDGMIGEC